MPSDRSVQLADESVGGLSYLEFRGHSRVGSRSPSIARQRWRDSTNSSGRKR